MQATDIGYPRKRARMRRTHDGPWTPVEELRFSASPILPIVIPTFSTPVASPFPHASKPSLAHIDAASSSTDANNIQARLRLRARALASDIDSSSIPVSKENPAGPEAPRSRPKSTDTGSSTPTARRPPSSAAPANASPKAKAVVGDSSNSPFWSNAGGIFQPDAQNPIPISPANAPALQQLPNGLPLASLSLPITGSVPAISALVFDPSFMQQTATLNPPTSPSSQSQTLRRVPSPPSATLPSSSFAFQSLLRTSEPTTVTETRSTLATSSSLLLTTALVSASQSSISPSTSPTPSVQSSSTSAAPASASSSPTNFFATLGSSTVNITITVLVCVGILALIIAFLFFFIRRCQRRRKKRRLGDILGSEFGSPGGNGFSGMSEWATPGPGWTEKYYGEQIGGRMVGSTGHGIGGGGGRSSSAGHGDEVEYWQRDYTGAMGVEGGYGVARTLSQDRRTSEWANYRREGGEGENEIVSRESLGDADDGGIAYQTHILEYGSHEYAAPAHPPPATIRPRSEPDFTLLAPPAPTNRPRSRPQPVPSHSYSSYASESMYPVDEVGDIEAEKKELSDTMSALNLGGSNRNDNSNTPPTQSSWRDSLDWVMGSAADLIGSKLLARGGSADTLVASPAKKENKEHDHFTERPPSIRIPRQAVDPLEVSDQFTPLSPSYGDRFLDPSQSNPTPCLLSRQSSMTSLTSSANFMTTNQQGTFAQSARSRLFDASVAQHAQDKDEMEILDDLAAAMMSRQTTNYTNTSELPPSLPPLFDVTPLSTSRRFVSSPVDMSRTSSASTSSSFTYRPSPPSNPFLTPPEMRQARSTSSMDSKSSFDAFGRGTLTPREYERKLSMSEARKRNRENRVVAPTIEHCSSLNSISTFNEYDTDYFTEGRSPETEEKARELLGERRRRSAEFEESLV
ncbi:hypothetical protein JCM5350_002666 [Sporobolomyces pararoseus]